jgi:transposase
MDNVKLIAIDIAKNIHQICGGNASGKILLKKRITSKKLNELIIQLPPDCTIVMEAGRMSNYWGRHFNSKGYKVKLIAPQFVKPFVKGNKNDANDSLAIFEAARRPDMRFVSVKTLKQQDIQSIHRARSLLKHQWVAIGNQIRGFLSEYGETIPVGACHLKKVPELLENAENGLTAQIREIVNTLYKQYKELEKLITLQEKHMQNIASQDSDCQRLMKLPGIGYMTATAIVSSVGNGSVFKNGMEMASWLGLVPKHRASGKNKVMQGISKRGDCYLRTLLIHGGRSVAIYCDKKTDKRSKWILDKKLRLGMQKASVAIANKMAREMWAILNKGDKFVFGV